MQSLGILGGTFDPIHYGHLNISEAAISQGLVDRVLLMPSGKPPHKKATASSQDRLAMTMLAAWGRERGDVSPIEATALTICYTSDTLERLSQLYPDTALYLILGADAAERVPMWKNQDKIRQFCSGILIAPRGSRNHPVEIPGMSVRSIAMEETEHTATWIREHAEEDIEKLTPVAEYIRQHGLYGAGECELIARLRGSMPVTRFQHTLSVATTAVCLAYLHGVDPWKAHLAGMLHDCAKGLPMPEQYEWIKKGNIQAEADELELPAIVHAPAGVAVAREIYGVTDEDILSAIRWHTTGRRGMSGLDKVVYLADMIEPLRRPFPGLTRIRQIAYRDLDGAVRLAARISADHILGSGRQILRRTLELLEETNTPKA